MISHWKDIASLILLAALIISIQRCNSERSERLKMKSELSRQETVARIEMQHRQVLEREKKYPAIDRRLKEIGKLKGKTREEVSNVVQKADVNRLGDMFIARGYSCKVIQ